MDIFCGSRFNNEKPLTGADPIDGITWARTGLDLASHRHHPRHLPHSAPRKSSWSIQSPLHKPPTVQPVRVKMSSPKLPSTYDSPPSGLRPSGRLTRDTDAPDNTFTSAPIVADTFTVISFDPHWPETC
jgi:hypothetical protein